MVLAILPVPMLAPFSGCKDKEQARQVAPPEVEVVAIEQIHIPTYRERLGTWDHEFNTTIPAQL